MIDSTLGLHCEHLLALMMVLPKFSLRDNTCTRRLMLLRSTLDSFVTGSRDGSVCQWDLREQPKRVEHYRWSDPMPSPYHDPIRRVRDAHADTCEQQC